VEGETLTPTKDERRSPPRARTIYDFERGRQLGVGSYSEVFSARCKITGDKVAVKRYKTLEIEKHEGFPINNMREIKLLQMYKDCRCENLINLREVVTDKMKSFYLIMDDGGRDLRRILKSNRESFILSEVKSILLQLLTAVSALHSNGIMHRDIKSANILLDQKGSVRLCDLGLARTCEERGCYSPNVVTPAYRPPELLLGADRYGPSIDMWCVGCVFAELVLGDLLFTSDSEISQIYEIFELLGYPGDDWEGWRDFPLAKKITFKKLKRKDLRQTFMQRRKFLTSHGFDLLEGLLALNPQKRLTAKEALSHPYFTEAPAPEKPTILLK